MQICAGDIYMVFSGMVTCLLSLWKIYGFWCWEAFKFWRFNSI